MTRKFSLVFKMDNSAFVEDWRHEAARIMRDMANAVDNGIVSCSVLDINGNTVGKLAVTGEKIRGE